MKIQTEYLDNERGITHFTQLFETESEKKISAEDYCKAKDVLQYLIDMLSDGEKVELCVRKIE
jgi:phage/plasmid-associated DNA primase